LEKAIDYWDIDEMGSNYPAHLYTNPANKEDYFDEIAIRQT
jgi:hypothetical protein